MSVTLVTMDSSYLRLGISSHHHHHHHRHHVLSEPKSHVVPQEDRQPDHQQDTGQPLRFSVVNILRPDFGRKALLTKQPVSSTSLTRHSPLPLPRDLSLSSTRLSPQSVHKEKDNFPSHNGLASPLPRQSGLSRSGSLESLASSRSSGTGSTVTGPSSLCSTSGGEPLNGDNTSGGSTGSTSTSQRNGQSQLWPAWVYCTRYSDRPSSGKFDRHHFTSLLVDINIFQKETICCHVNNRRIELAFYFKDFNDWRNSFFDFFVRVIFLSLTSSRVSAWLLNWCV